MANSADPDQLASELALHCLQRQGTSGFSRTRVNLYHSLCKFSRLQIGDIFLIFLRKQALSFHANGLLSIFIKGQNFLF